MSQPSSGPDPGRNGAVELDPNTYPDSDDLDLGTVLAAMVTHNITLIALHSSPDPDPAHPEPDGLAFWPAVSAFRSTLFEYWQKYAEITGAAAVRINPDGTVPEGAGSIAGLVAGLILEEVSQIDTISLKASPAQSAGWLTSVPPAAYTGINLQTSWSGFFDLVLAVPPRTDSGE